MKLNILSALLLSCSTTMAADYNRQTLEKAHGLFRGATNTAMYAEAAQQYEYLVKEEGIRNGHLFYTQGNAWFMADDLGRAILNYRRAGHYLPNTDDVQHNLNTALEQRTEAREVLARILHLDPGNQWATDKLDELAGGD